MLWGKVKDYWLFFTKALLNSVERELHGRIQALLTWEVILFLATMPLSMLFLAHVRTTRHDEKGIVMSAGYRAEGMPFTCLNIQAILVGFL